MKQYVLLAITLIGCGKSELQLLSEKARSESITVAERLKVAKHEYRLGEIDSAVTHLTLLSPISEGRAEIELAQIYYEQDDFKTALAWCIVRNRLGHSGGPDDAMGYYCGSKVTESERTDVAIKAASLMEEINRIENNSRIQRGERVPTVADP